MLSKAPWRSGRSHWLFYHNKPSAVYCLCARIMNLSAAGSEAGLCCSLRHSASCKMGNSACFHVMRSRPRIETSDIHTLPIDLPFFLQKLIYFAKINNSYNLEPCPNTQWSINIKLFALFIRVAKIKIITRYKKRQRIRKSIFFRLDMERGQLSLLSTENIQQKGQLDWSSAYSMSI